jgi:hypothetical protein
VVVTAQGAQATVTVVHHHLVNAQVELWGVPIGFSPAIGASEALSLTLHQLGSDVPLDDAHLYLGMFRVHGTPTSAIAAWVLVIGPSGALCGPTSGTGGMTAVPTRDPSAAGCFLGVTIDATSGAFIVAGSG